jgi:hypothetical protein
MKHDIQTWKSPINFTVRCPCGFVRVISRKQNALARASKVRSAYTAHNKIMKLEQEQK